jgi:hypothetical protein
VDDGANTLENRREIGRSDVSDFDSLKLWVFFKRFLQQRNFTASGGSEEIKLVRLLYSKKIDKYPLTEYPA